MPKIRKLSLYLLLAADLLLGWVALVLGTIVRFGAGQAPLLLHQMSPFKPLFFAATLVLISYICELYPLGRPLSRVMLLARTACSALMSLIFLSVLFFLCPSLMLGRGLLALALAAFVLLQFLLHQGFCTLYLQPMLRVRTMVLGQGELGTRVVQLVRGAERDQAVTLVAVMRFGEDEAPSHADDSRLQNPAELLPCALRFKIAVLVVALDQSRMNGELQNALLNCKLHGIKVIDPATFTEAISRKLMLEQVSPSWFIFSDGFRYAGGTPLPKRALDVLLALFGLLIALPLTPLIALLVKLGSPGPVIYRQLRVGQFGKNFTIYKFRTMPVDCEKGTGAVWASQGDNRAGMIGSWLRKTRLDELPQLVNVLLGDMSFVGPRPERPEFVSRLDHLIPYYTKRHFLRPGLTGWAQVNYPYGASVEDAHEKLKYDLYYFKNMSPFLDLLIILQTVRVVLFQQGGR